MQCLIQQAVLRHFTWQIYRKNIFYVIKSRFKQTCLNHNKYDMLTQNIDRGGWMDID